MEQAAVDPELCLSGDRCREPAVPSTMFPGKRRFCSRHQEVLDRCCAEMRQRGMEKGPKNKKKATVAFCANGCDERPVQGSDLCYKCLDDDSADGS